MAKKSKHLILESIDRLEQQTVILDFISEMLHSCKGSENYDEFFLNGTQASIENVADNLRALTKECQKHIRKAKRKA